MASFLTRTLQSMERLWTSTWSRLEPHAHTIATAFIASVSFGLIAGANYWSGHSERIPVTALYVGSWLLMFATPVFLVWAHRHRQQLVISRVRGLYAVAAEYLAQERVADARRLLLSIRRWELHWHIGNSLIYRIGYGVFVIGATVLIAAIHQLTYAHVYSQTGYDQMAHDSLVDTVRYLLDHPVQLWMYGIISVLFGFGAIQHLKDLAGTPWSEFYGDRLEATIKAGRTVSEAPWHDQPMPQEGLSARELLGLPKVFTAAQLRRAWLGLVRELHPDRWATAGAGVRAMKEAALKRVNAARDELAAQVSG